MRDSTDNRAPEEIERDIERTRAEVSSTIDAIQSKLTPGQMMDQALSYARTSLPADFGSNLSQTVRENPVPVALIGIGIAWLMKSGQQSNQPSNTPARVHRTSSINHVDSELYPTRSSVSDYPYDTTSYNSAETEREGKMSRVASKVSEKGHDLKERTRDTAGAISQKAGDISHRGQEQYYRAKDSISQKAGDIGHRSQEQYYRAKDGISQMLEEQPLVLGALGIAVGAAIGAALPATAREDELLGDKRDSILDSAKQMAQEQGEKVKVKAQQTLSEAEKKLQEQKEGSTAESSGDGQTADQEGKWQYPSTGSSAGGLDENRGQTSVH